MKSNDHNIPNEFRVDSRRASERDSGMHKGVPEHARRAAHKELATQNARSVGRPQRGERSEYQPSNVRGNGYIRSFVLRQGRETSGQKTAFDKLWPKYGLSTEKTLDSKAEFGRNAPVIIDIGFGMGPGLCHMAERHPEYNFVGIEVHRPGVSALMRQIERSKINNIRIYHHDAVEILERCIPPESVSNLQLFFSDPWPKKRHHKRRLIQPPFINLIHNTLNPEGTFYFISDWQPYAEQVQTLFNADQRFIDVLSSETYQMLYHDRLITKFEQKGFEAGRKSHEVFFQKKLANKLTFR